MLTGTAILLSPVNGISAKLSHPPICQPISSEKRNNHPRKSFL